MSNQIEDEQSYLIHDFCVTYNGCNEIGDEGCVCDEYADQQDPNACIDMDNPVWDKP